MYLYGIEKEVKKWCLILFKNFHDVLINICFILMLMRDDAIQVKGSLEDEDIENRNREGQRFVASQRKTQ